jgi:hypothetical protein
MAVQMIGYQNKVALNTDPEIADINKVTDNDMNEIKAVVNNNAIEFNGYQKNKVVLWENNSLNTNFATQTVTLSQPIENFNYYTVLFYQATNSYLTISASAKAGDTIRAITIGGALINYRDITYMSGTSCTFSNTTAYATYAGSGSTANQRLIPYRIIGEY